MSISINTLQKIQDDLSNHESLINMISPKSLAIKQMLLLNIQDIKDKINKILIKEHK